MRTGCTSTQEEKASPFESRAATSFSITIPSWGHSWARPKTRFLYSSPGNHTLDEVQWQLPPKYSFKLSTRRAGASARCKATIGHVARQGASRSVNVQDFSDARRLGRRETIYGVRIATDRQHRQSRNA